jgi:hypothetical protein
MPHDNKTIELRVHFWTNDISPTEGEITPKHGLAKGTVHITANTLHGIAPEQKAHFNTLMELPLAIEKVLIAHGIVLHPGEKMSKYMRTLERREPEDQAA